MLGQLSSPLEKSTIGSQSYMKINSNVTNKTTKVDKNTFSYIYNLEGEKACFVNPKS